MGHGGFTGILGIPEKDAWTRGQSTLAPPGARRGDFSPSSSRESRNSRGAT